MELHKQYDFLMTQQQDIPLYKGMDWETYQGNRRLRREMERWIEQTLNAFLDVAKIILAERKETLPETNRDILKRAGQLFCPELLLASGAGKVVADRWAELRNQMAHEYLDMRWDGIKSFLEHIDIVISGFLSTLQKRIEAE